MKKITGGFRSIALISILFSPSLSFVDDILIVFSYTLQLHVNLMSTFANSNQVSHTQKRNTSTTAI